MIKYNIANALSDHCSCLLKGRFFRRAKKSTTWKITQSLCLRQKNDSINYSSEQNVRNVFTELSNYCKRV